MKIFRFIFFLFLTTNLAAQDSLTIQDAIRYAIAHNFNLIIAKNSIEIGKINNNWAVAGAYPVVSANASKTIGLNNTSQKLNSGADIKKTGSVSQNLNAGLSATWQVFNGFKVFATKHRLEELERSGEYTFTQSLNLTVYNVISGYYNIVKLSEQLKAAAEQIKLYTERYNLADMKFNIGSGAKYDVLQANVDLNEQKSNMLTIQNQIDLAKTNFKSLLGYNADTAYKVADTIIIHPVEDMATVQGKMLSKNPDLLLASSQLAILFQTRKEINANRLPVVTLNGNYNFVRSSNGAGLTLYNQTYGPTLSVGVAVPLFNGGIIRKQLQVTDVQIQNQNVSIESVRNTLNTSLTNAYINYQNALNIISLEKSNLVLASESVSIASQRFKLLNITSVELRQVQISYYDAKTRLYNALYQAKLAEAELVMLSGEMADL
ncbi:MAG: TolC family protein [Chitinophagaceae bacterium]|nr:TolC family protein [Chitinophagaceae bacterium]